MLEETFFRKWLEGSISEDEISRQGREAFDDDKEWAAFKQLIDGSRNLEPPAGKTMEEAWSKLEGKIALRQAPAPRNTKKQILMLYKKPVARYLSIAAAIVIIFTFYSIFISENPTIYKTAKGETKTITLPDNSVIILNADSRLSCLEGNWKNSRSVSLEGEAFFDVKKGTKFEVNSEVGKVTVLGTSFNVKARKQRYEVSCFTGKVSVSLYNDSSEMVLSDGLATKIMNQKLSGPFDFKAKNVGGWRLGEYYFEKRPLTEVLDEFERQFNVRLQINADLKDRIYSGYFSNADMVKALESICLPMNLQFEIQNDNAVIIY